MKLLCNGWHPLVFHIPQLQDFSIDRIIKPLKKRTNLIAQVTVPPFRFGILLLGFHQADSAASDGGSQQRFKTVALVQKSEK